MCPLGAVETEAGNYVFQGIQEHLMLLFKIFFLLFLSLSTSLIFSQVMGKWWDEAVLLRIGLKLEEFRCQTKKPSIYYDVLA